MRWKLAALPMLLAGLLSAPAYADDPVVNYVRVSVDSDQQLSCNDLNVEIANVNRDIGLLESQDEELQGVASQGVQTFVPQSSNAGNVFEALGNTLGDAAVIDAEDSIPAVEASLSTARARVGYLESLQGSCGNNNAPPPQQQAPPQQQQALAVDASDPPANAAVRVSICNRTNWTAFLWLLHATGTGQQDIVQGYWTIPAGVCAPINPPLRRGKINFYANAYDKNNSLAHQWQGNDGWFCSVTGVALYVYAQACGAGQQTFHGTLVDLTNQSAWTEILTADGMSGSPTGSSAKPSSHKKHRR